MFNITFRVIYNFICNYFNTDESNGSVESSNELDKSKTSNINHKLQNFYYLSLIEEPDGTFSIHGLWPQYTTKTYPSFCKKVVFDINKLSPILPDLNRNWYSNKGNNPNFWEHEYLKHGSCVFTPIDEFQYFDTSLELFKKAIQLELPSKFYNKNTKKCLIPVDQQFEFIL